MSIARTLLDGNLIHSTSNIHSCSVLSLKLR